MGMDESDNETLNARMLDQEVREAIDRYCGRVSVWSVVGILAGLIFELNFNAANFRVRLPAGQQEAQE
jgi:hypothetical protein